MSYPKDCADWQTTAQKMEIPRDTEVRDDFEGFLTQSGSNPSRKTCQHPRGAAWWHGQGCHRQESGQLSSSLLAPWSGQSLRCDRREIRWNHMALPHTGTRWHGQTHRLQGSCQQSIRLHASWTLQGICDMERNIRCNRCTTVLGATIDRHEEMHQVKSLHHSPGCNDRSAWRETSGEIVAPRVFDLMFLFMPIYRCTQDFVATIDRHEDQNQMKSLHQRLGCNDRSAWRAESDQIVAHAWETRRENCIGWSWCTGVWHTHGRQGEWSV